MWFVIGSRAANQVFADFYRDIENSDWDVWTTKEEFYQWFSNKPQELKSCYPIRPGKFHLTFKDLRKMELGLYNEASLYSFVEVTPEIWHEEKIVVPHIGSAVSLNAKCLALLKKSHLSWNIHWEKNNNDFQWMQAHCDLNTLSIHEEMFYQKAFEKMSEIHKEKPLREVPTNKLKI